MRFVAPRLRSTLLLLALAAGCRREGGSLRSLFEAIQRHAAGQGSISEVVRFLNEGGNVNEAAPDGTSPLLMASFLADPEVARLLTERGADVNAANGKGVTPLLGALTMAAFGHASGRLEKPELVLRHAEIVRLLVAKGADVNARSKDGMSPLKLARLGGNRELVDLLVRAGARE